MSENAVSQDSNSDKGRAVFASTHWSVVVEAGQSDSTKASEAMAQLCRTYWYPLYAYVRRKGYSPHDAQDLTQEFFAKLLAGNYVGAADRRKGKFRSFLLGALEHFLGKEWRRTHAEKRGAGQTPISLDELDAEDRYLLEPADELTPASLFDRRWAATLLETALKRLEAECQEGNKADFFLKARDLLSGHGAEASYAQLATSLSMSEGAFKVAIHRLRQRYGELIRLEILETLTDPDDVDQELQYLLAAVRE